MPEPLKDRDAARPLADRIAAVESWVKKRDTVSPATVNSLAREHRLTSKEVRVIIDRARYKLGANAEKYVAAHLESIDLGLELAREGGKSAAQGLAVAQKGAEWAIERIGQGSSRIVDAPKVGTGQTGPQILIGIAVGGVNPQNPVVESDPEPLAIEGEVQETPPPSQKRINTKAMEAKVQKLLAAVTPETAQSITRAIVDEGLSPKFAWEMVKEMLAVNERDV